MRAAGRRRSPRSARLRCTHLSMLCSRPRGTPSIWPAGKGSVRVARTPRHGRLGVRRLSGGHRQGRDLARRSGVGDRCRFVVVDLDNGLPAGSPVDVILCHKFGDRRLDRGPPAALHRAACW